ncbi:MAG: ABC transporter ATP-binding protein [Hymenobacteraceae bacterium]|nr:ABC transporter ATP-binding protein [Hymenobacteraceae bacterium]MDX5396077.1 ABC transporter ATP-binding protein [Hymenobacteraceae bacterium]MDX5443400.1 ABC transporter ATP-binding protein [Hymenobacteraceae bacterium]MDX5512142.1 ABC transporter ATP-binding protein [Hymenobacteraceae bacterium]
MLKLRQIQKIYRADEIETTALNNISLEIQRGEFVSVMGPSGCGKSTLLNILGLIDCPDSGEFLFLGKEASRLSEGKRADLRRDHIGFVFQSFNLIDELNVFENVEVALLYTGIKAAQRKKMVKEVLEKLHMIHRKNHYPQQLSGGQQQRVAIARAIVNNPELLLADEPTGNLDSANSNAIMQLLTDLNAEGTTIVMVTHSAYDAEFSQRIIRLLDGQVLAENKLATLV